MAGELLNKTAEKGGNRIGRVPSDQEKKRSGSQQRKSCTPAGVSRESRTLTAKLVALNGKTYEA